MMNINQKIKINNKIKIFKVCVHSINFDDAESRLVVKERDQALRVLVLFF